MLSKPQEAYSWPSYRCCPSTIQNTSMSHNLTLGDMFIHHNEHGPCAVFWVPGTCIILLTKTLVWVCFNPHLNIVPNRFLLYSCLINQRWQCPACSKLKWWSMISFWRFLQPEHIVLRLTATDRVGPWERHDIIGIFLRFVVNRKIRSLILWMKWF